MKMRVVLFLFILWSSSSGFSALAQSQDYKLSAYTIEREKQPDYSPYEIYIDDNGFMWLWSSTGLYYHNGRDFVPSGGKEIKRASGDIQVVFFSDVNGFIWIVQYNLLSHQSDFPWRNSVVRIVDVLNKKEFSFAEYFEKVDIPHESNLQGIVQGTNNELWISFNTGEVYVFREGAILEKVIDTRRNLDLSYVLPASDTSYWTLVSNSLLEIDACGNILEEESLPLIPVLIKKGRQKNSIILYTKDFEGTFQAFYKKYGYPYCSDIPYLQYDIPANTPILVGENNEVIALEPDSIRWLSSNGKNDAFSSEKLSNHKFWKKEPQLDRRGRLWGINHSDLTCIQRSEVIFDRIDKEVKIGNTRGIVSLNDSTLWVNSSQGVYIIGKNGIRNLSFKDSRFKAGLGNFYSQNDDLLMAGFFPGILRIKEANLTYDTLDILMDDDLRFRTPAGRMFKLDTKNRLWLATQVGLAFYDVEKDHFQITKNCLFEKTDTYHIHESNEGLWLSISDGIKLYLPEQDTIININSFPSEYVTFIHESEGNQFWIGTKGQGLYSWNRSTGKLKQYTKEHGLENMVVHAIYEDSKKCLWLPTNNGLYHFNPETEAFQSFYVENGLCGNEFNMYSHLQTRDGYLYFGGIDGIIGFHPDHMEALPKRDELFYLESVAYILSDGSEEKDSTFRHDNRQFVLKKNYKGIKLYFAWLDRWDNKDKTFYYRSMGEENEWKEMVTGVLDIHSLAIGFHFIDVKVKAANGEEAPYYISIVVEVPSPWYQKPVFWIAAIILLVLLIRWFLHLRTQQLVWEKKKLEAEVLKRTLEIEKERKLVKEQNERLTSLNQMKDRLFAIIGHELRAPIGYFQNVGKNLNYLLQKKEYKRALNLSERLESTSLMAHSILNNLLKMGLVETGRFPIHIEPIDLMEIVTESIDSFAPIADQKDLELARCTMNTETCIAYADKNSIRLIINNLIGNAIKFTPAGGKICIQLFQKEKEGGFIVKDTGAGIPKEQLEKIFQMNFTTEGTEGEKGTGMGLYLCRQLAELNRGRIEVKSTLGKGTEMKLVLSFAE